MLILIFYSIIVIIRIIIHIITILKNELVSNIDNNKFLYLTQSEKLNDVRNINDIWDNMNSQFFTDNNIRLSETSYEEEFLFNIFKIRRFKFRSKR